MKEVERSEHSGAVVWTKSSSGCLIIKKKAVYGVEGVGGFNDSSSRSLLNSTKEKKRLRVGLSDSESSDELSEPIRRKVDKFHSGSVRVLMGNKGFQTERRVNNGLDELDEKRISKNLNKKKSVMQSSSFLDLNRPGKLVPLKGKEDSELKLAASGKETYESDASLQFKPSSRRHSRTMEVVKRKATINPRTKNVTSVKGKESKIKRTTCTEKQLLREKIKKMLFGAGWTIDYRPRKNRDYWDSVYVSPAGTGYWSITKAYEALRKEEQASSKAGGDFTLLPDEILSKLTRQTRKKLEREMKNNRRHEGNNRKAKRVRVEMAARLLAIDKHKEKLGSYTRHSRRSSESRLEEASQDDLSDNSNKGTPKKNGNAKTTVGTSSHIVQGRKSRRIGRCTLLVRGSDNELSSENNGFVPYSGMRTLITWLIDSGTVCVGEKVQYMNLRKTRVMQEGWITNDGIHCGCCSKILTILRFELHAGSKLGQPSRNTFLPSGQSLMQCQIETWNKQEESERMGFHAVDVDGGDPNDDTCGLCGDGGDLICCDGCPSTFHLSCLDMQMLPQGDWHCPNCACKYCKIVGGNCTEGSGRTECSLLSCHLCEKKYHKSCSPEMDDKPIDSNDLNFPFCGHECRELHSRMQKLLWNKHELDSGFSWSLIRRSHPLPDASSVEFSQRVECNSKLAIALLVMDECFLPIVDRRSGISVIHNVVYGCGSNFSRLNHSGFFTAILERGDEMICAASIRIHGTQLAEMPFIATRHIYRHQGMCRRLFHAIESALSSLNIEKLVIPAIAEHMHTWTNAFGFRPLKESLKREMRSMNMLVFPGTDMLQKPLVKRGKKGVGAEDCGAPFAKKPYLNHAAMRNGANTSERKTPFFRRKSDAKSDGDGNETTDVITGADSASKVKKIDLQDGNGIGIVSSLETRVPDDDSDSDSIDVQNGNGTNLDTHSDSEVEETEVQNDCDSIDAHCMRR